MDVEVHRSRWSRRGLWIISSGLCVRLATIGRRRSDGRRWRLMVVVQGSLRLHVVYHRWLGRGRWMGSEFTWSKSKTTVFQCSGCSGGCKLVEFQRLEQVLYKMARNRQWSRRLGTCYSCEVLVMTRWGHCEYWWIWHQLRSSTTERWIWQISIRVADL